MSNVPAIVMAMTMTTMVLAVGAYGCGAESDRPPPADDYGAVTVTPATNNASETTTLRSGPCDTEGAIATCSVSTGRVGATVNCYHGMQACAGGTWSPCGPNVDAGHD